MALQGRAHLSSRGVGHRGPSSGGRRARTDRGMIGGTVPPAGGLPSQAVPARSRAGGALYGGVLSMCSTSCASGTLPPGRLPGRSHTDASRTWPLAAPSAASTGTQPAPQPATRRARYPTLRQTAVMHKHPHRRWRGGPVLRRHVSRGCIVRHACSIEDAVPLVASHERC